MNRTDDDDERAGANPPAAEKILIGLWAVIDACREMLACHLQPNDIYCECHLCRDADGLLYNAELAQACIDGQLGSFPAWEERTREVLRRAKAKANAKDPAEAASPCYVVEGR